jgi:hypothetical protein
MVKLEFYAVLEDFFKCIGRIEHADIKKFVYEALQETPDEFWTAPASSSKKHHPPESNIEPLGLIAHVVKASVIAEGLFLFLGITHSMDKDIVRAALVLHDTFKGGPGAWEGTFEEHAYYAMRSLKHIEMSDEYVKDKLLSAIETHMSRWGRPFSTVTNFLFPDKINFIVALSDMIASRGDISFYPGISAIDEDEEE